MVARSEQVDDSPKNYFCRDPTSRRRSSDSASHANWMEFTTETSSHTGHATMPGIMQSSCLRPRT